VADDVLDPDRAAAAGAAFGQLACTLPSGALLLSASRLIELGVRATVLLAPGLFRLDLTPQDEALGVITRPLTSHAVRWHADESAWDGYRDANAAAPLELRGRFELPDGALTAAVRIVSIADPDAAAVHFVAKAEIG
jgi:hypothetical protein